MDAHADHQISLELTHPSGGSDGRRAQLRIMDGPSRLLVLSVDIPPDAFYNLLAGMVNSDRLPAKLLTPHAYQRVGKQRHFWTRRIGYGVAQPFAESWAEKLRVDLLMETASVRSRQGGLFATWTYWSNNLTEADHASIQETIDRAPLPEGAR